jgi:hypothetical protein
MPLRRRRLTGRFRHRRQRPRHRTEQGRRQRHGKGKTRADQTMGTVPAGMIVLMVRRTMVLPGAGSVANLVHRRHIRRQAGEWSRRHRAPGHQHQGQCREQGQQDPPLPDKVPLSDAPHAHNCRDSCFVGAEGFTRCDPTSPCAAA